MEVDIRTVVWCPALLGLTQTESKSKNGPDLYCLALASAVNSINK